MSEKFRKREKPFTQISNHLLRDENISLKAKGLYSLIASYLNMIDFVLYKGTLRKNCQEGRDAFDKAWNELKNAGYLVQYKVKGDNGRFEYEYELLDEPAEEDNSKTVSQDKTVELTIGNSTYGFSVSGNPVNGKPESEESVSIQYTEETNNRQKNNLQTNNNVVGEKDVCDFFAKNEEWLSAIMSVDYAKDEIQAVYESLQKLLPKLPKDCVEKFRNLSKGQAEDFFKQAWEIYYPKVPHNMIFNPEGYLIGYFRNNY